MNRKLSDTYLQTLYYTLKTDSYEHSVWNDVTVSKAVRAVPESVGTGFRWMISFPFFCISALLLTFNLAIIINITPPIATDLVLILLCMF